MKLSTSPFARATLSLGGSVVSFAGADPAGCQGPEAAKPNARTLEPFASAIARPAGLSPG